ncbi:BspA family leucine-rich repeat surface protein [Xylocopilactobacillus apicola]|uniref:Surface protein n=1 Tax=Xylocopilactobacillus apicola TaxID=2932184 RepID=A0AAU9CZ39_9LACO|nr:BspA family leucine-rich repeat surface protein [Xylocopilactobacillus apicola]BDR59287.1 hypothetical protein XA3_17280 [Xylocopilactobacillus apicola]
MNKKWKCLSIIPFVLVGFFVISLEIASGSFSKAFERKENVTVSPKETDNSKPIFRPDFQTRIERALQPITTEPGETQFFFSTFGNASAQLNENGKWDTIEITKPILWQRGAAVLNTSVDMTQDFTFNWDLKIDRGTTDLADGLGFSFHPIYKPGQTILDSQGGDSYVLPEVFGRHSNTTPVTSATDPDNGQKIHSLGLSGGDLGFSDLMNVIGFKIDTYFNTPNGRKQPGTSYGNPGHAVNYLSNDDETTPFGAFVETDNTGFAMPGRYSWRLVADETTPITGKSDAYGGVSGIPSKIADGKWHPMTISYASSTNTFKVTIAGSEGNSIHKMTWSRVLTPNELAVIADRKKWAFAIHGSTGAGNELNVIRDVHGTFTPGDPVVITRYVDENGNDLKDTVSTMLEDWQELHPGSTQFVDNSSPETIVKNGKTYRRAQVNGTFFKDGTRTHRRLGPSGVGTTAVSSGSNVEVKTEFDLVTFINYVYRQDLTTGSTDVTSDLQLSTDGTTFSKTANIHPGDKVTFKYTAKNNTLPIWSKVTAVQSLGGLFTPTGTLPAGVTQSSGLLYVPLNTGSTNDLRLGETGTNTVKMKYEGVEKASLTSNDAGQITITNNPATPGAAKTSTIVSKVSIYDQSNQLIDDSGSPIYGSYFYNAANSQAPLANTETVYNTANYVPTTDSVTVNDQGWWDFNATTKVLTIYPHELNYEDDKELESSGRNYSFPWSENYSLQIEKTVIKPGVTAKGSLRTLFYDQENMTTIEGLEDLDTSEVTDMYFMFCLCRSLTNLDVSNFNTSKVTNMGTMFGNCWSLTSLDVKNFDTHNVTDMSEMFKSCEKVTNLEVKDFDTSKVTTMLRMFHGCESLTSLDVTGFNTSNVTNMQSIFGFCRLLTGLDLRSFDTSKVTDMSDMFVYDNSLSDLKWNATKFNTNNVTDMQRMFNECSSLNVIDVSHFDTSKVTNVRRMFNECTSLASLDLSSFDLTNVVHKVDSNYVDSGYYEMLADTPKLWKLTLGPNTKFPDVTVSGTLISTKLADPTPGNKVIDLDSPVPPNPQYYATNAQWREVVTPGLEHVPDGAAKTAAEILSESATRNDVRTYVWDQIGKQTLEATPGNIDLGTHLGALRNQEYKSSAQNLKLTDNRNARAGKNWRIEAAVTKPFKHATDPTKVISGDPLYYHDTTLGTKTHLTSTAQLLYNGTATSDYQDVKNYPWNLSFKASPSGIPKAGKYNATVTFTLVNVIP